MATSSVVVRYAEPAAMAAGGALLFLDVCLGLLEPRVVDDDDRRFSGARAWLAHRTVIEQTPLLRSGF